MRMVLCLLAGGLAACGGGSNPTQEFIGVWQYAQGSMIMATCAHLGQQNQDLSGKNVTFAAGVSGGSSLTQVDSSGCDINLTVSGTTATAVAGQTCTASMSGIMSTTTISSLTYTTANGTTMTANSSGTTTLTTAVASDTCTGGETNVMLTKTAM
jgi:hypothetical protein